MADGDQASQSGQPQTDAAPAADPGVVEYEQFGDYAKAYFRATRGPWAFGIVAAILAAPVLSLLKPKLAVPGLGLVLGGVAAAALLFFALFYFGRFVAYTAASSRTVGESSRSFVAPLAFITLLMLIVLTPVVIAECFSGPNGWLAQMAPPMQQLQADLGLNAPDDEQLAQADNQVDDDDRTQNKDADETGSAATARGAEANSADTTTAANADGADANGRPLFEPPPEDPFESGDGANRTQTPPNGGSPDTTSDPATGQPGVANQAAVAPTIPFPDPPENRREGDPDRDPTAPPTSEPNNAADVAPTDEPRPGLTTNSNDAPTNPPDQPGLPTGPAGTDGAASDATAKTATAASKPPPRPKRVIERLKSVGRVVPFEQFVDFYAQQFPKRFEELNQAELNRLTEPQQASLQENDYFPHSTPRANYPGGDKGFEETAKAAEQRIAEGLDAVADVFFELKPIGVYGVPVFGDSFDASTLQMRSVLIPLRPRNQTTGGPQCEVLPLTSVEKPQSSLVAAASERVGPITDSNNALRLSNVSLPLADGAAYQARFAAGAIHAALVFEYPGYVAPRPDAKVRLPLLLRQVLLYDPGTERVLVSVDLSEQQLHPDLMRLPLARNPYPGREMREWTDSRGVARTAKFLRRERDVVHLVDKNGKPWEIPLKNLSARDRNLARQIKD